MEPACRTLWWWVSWKLIWSGGSTGGQDAEQACFQGEPVGSAGVA